MESLSFVDCNLTASSVQAIEKYISTPPGTSNSRKRWTLAHFDLSGNDFSEDDENHFIELFSKCSSKNRANKLVLQPSSPKNNDVIANEMRNPPRSTRNSLPTSPASAASPSSKLQKLEPEPKSEPVHQAEIATTKEQELQDIFPETKDDQVPDDEVLNESEHQISPNPELNHHSEPELEPNSQSEPKNESTPKASEEAEKPEQIEQNTEKTETLQIEKEEEEIGEEEVIIEPKKEEEEKLQKPLSAAAKLAKLDFSSSITNSDAPQEFKEEEEEEFNEAPVTQAKPQPEQNQPEPKTQQKPEKKPIQDEIGNEIEEEDEEEDDLEMFVPKHGEEIKDLQEKLMKVANAVEKAEPNEKNIKEENEHLRAEFEELKFKLNAEQIDDDTFLIGLQKGKAQDFHQILASYESQI